MLRASHRIWRLQASRCLSFEWWRRWLHRWLRWVDSSRCEAWEPTTGRNLSLVAAWTHLIARPPASRAIVPTTVPTAGASTTVPTADTSTTVPTADASATVPATLPLTPPFPPGIIVNDERDAPQAVLNGVQDRRRPISQVWR